MMIFNTIMATNFLSHEATIIPSLVNEESKGYVLKCRQNVTINAHSVEVFEALSRLSGIKLDNGEFKIQPGNKHGFFARFLHGQLSVVSAEPYTSMVMTSALMGFIVRYTWRITELKKMSDVNLECRMEGMYTRFFKSLLARRLFRICTRKLSMLKEQCELYS
jgi:hypothetical protein